ncbi:MULTISPECIES: GntR family transcriptional regulator [unclassified Beijerinckia]|uniref:GntR family transcriptional regulator n=1 Tax=unclassified Beijerinckia TaxID=2638183 RepID=UPI00089CADDA|nr:MULTISPECIES: GntR family transcriptional regulator [unclassified Beijerinckia]MDH7794399.1 GntR family transcriptional regulator of vanillate catabolism [Beijerinckia sp. GAS462]SEB61068.1 transcriptional regulator, GntR family [Beijerinckia sp. 28-YEA-48]
MTQQSQAVMKIREMILQGQLAPGERLAEAGVADMLGLSRTPVRQALPVLAEEGLLVPAGARGYSVRAFTTLEILEAVEVRGALEGLAARIVAERGASRALMRTLRDSLAEGDEIFAKRHLIEADEATYSRVNLKFHRCITDAAEHSFARDTLERIDRIPFASPAAIAFDRHGLPEMFDALWHAHRQHHAIVDAIDAGEGSRAEALFREHIYSQKRSMRLTRSQTTRSADLSPRHQPEED